MASSLRLVCQAAVQQHTKNAPFGTDHDHDGSRSIAKEKEDLERRERRVGRIMYTYLKRVDESQRK